jgi:hypothetical protein
MILIVTVRVRRSIEQAALVGAARRYPVMRAFSLIVGDLGGQVQRLAVC